MEQMAESQQPEESEGMRAMVPRSVWVKMVRSFVREEAVGWEATEMQGARDFVCVSRGPQFPHLPEIVSADLRITTCSTKRESIGSCRQEG